MKNATRPGCGRRRSWCPRWLRPAAAGLPGLLLALASGHLVLVRAQTPDRPTLSIAPTIAAASAAQVPFPIRVGRGPPGSFVRVRGLPLSAALSEGHAIARDAWVVPLNILPNLKITLPATVTSKADMVVELVGRDGTVLVEAKATLLIAATAPTPAPGSDARERAQRFVQKGNERLAEGLVAPARLLFERAADLGLAEAAWRWRRPTIRPS